jgi:hypothetical protein
VTPSESDFTFGKAKLVEATQKKFKKPEDVGVERMKETFNVGAGSKEHDELKRKREEFAV